MKPIKVLIFVFSWALFFSGKPGHAALLFDRSSDTVRLPDRVVVTSAATYEAWVEFTCDYGGFGYVFCQWAGAGEDKQFKIGPDRIEVHNFRGFGNPTPIFAVSLPLPPGVPHHVAYVFDGSEERLYLDGRLVASQLPSGNIVNDQLSVPVAALGNYNRDNDLNNGFIGYLFSLRIAGRALYSGSSFEPPPLRLSATTGSQIVANFDCSQTIGQPGVLPYPCARPPCNPTIPTCQASVPLAHLDLQNTSSGRVLIWNPAFVLFSATSLGGNFQLVPNASSPFIIDTSASQQRFFRLGCP